MEVGIEDVLQLEFMYNKQKYSLNDAITGKVYFLSVRIRIIKVVLEIIKREIIGSGN